MSRGLGYIEREIVAILKSRAGYHRETLAFSAWRLADDIYETDDWPPSAPKRVRRLAVLRAMHSLARKFPHRYALTGGKGTTPLYIYRVKRPPGGDDLDRPDYSTKKPVPFRSIPNRRLPNP